VFGIGDAHGGEDLAAWVRLRDGATVAADDLRAFCRGRLAYAKIPRHVRVVEAFPTTPTGHVQKFRMRAATTDELKLHRVP
jgi:fatty-acyl-CoA synthase